MIKRTSKRIKLINRRVCHATIKASAVVIIEVGVVGVRGVVDADIHIRGDVSIKMIKRARERIELINRGMGSEASETPTIIIIMVVAGL